ncbi:hypothetical protein [Georgenia ruanii]|uniref:Aromatic ring-opening dioxygenase LigA n=1 Tax=Georgenia ruanii TaxID=348442 RepID=A0A7J9UXZ6_9MICO|nr:hypothetical protein [Georgenia ruanii]MPV89508.1 hypothetical protein [Georgenia ruanii]
MRKTLDRLISWTGLILAAVLLVGGGLLTWASSFVAQNVKDQLAIQEITMPEGDALASLSEADRAALEPFAGDPMTTGDQAKAFADHYILAHMNASSDGRTYEQVSGEFMAASKDPGANPDDVAALGQLRQTLFMGNTLRGLLLEAYAFGMMGTIASYAAVAAFVGAAALAVLGVLGLRHAKKVEAADVAASSRPVPAGV